MYISDISTNHRASFDSSISVISICIHRRNVKTSCQLYSNTTRVHSDILIVPMQNTHDDNTVSETNVK